MDALADVAVAALDAVAHVADAGDAVAEVPFKYHRTTVKERYAIVALHEYGLSQMKIHMQLGIGRSAVGHWINVYKSTGDVKDASRSGRPRCTDDDTDHNIALTARIVKFTSPKQIKRSLELDASRSTIDRRLQQAELFGRVARHKRDYSAAEVVKRLACFAATDQGYCHIFNDTMDAKLMRDILKDNLVASANLHFDAEWFLLHDNDKKFTSILVKEFLHNNGVTCIEFPPYSPDLNPIENLWATMARACEKRNCDTLEALQDVVSDEWNKVDKILMRKLAHSMPKRCKAVTAAHGWHTKY